MADRADYRCGGNASGGLAFAHLFAYVIAKEHTGNDGDEYNGVVVPMHSIISFVASPFKCNI